jgi:hypothetical protein
MFSAPTGRNIFSWVTSPLRRITFQLERGRSRLVDDLMVRSDHNAVLLQIAALHRLILNEPRIAIVPGHEAAAIA